MKTAILILLVFAVSATQAQNVDIRKIPGMSHYEHKFIEQHRIGDVGEEKYPHISMYCRSNDSDMVMFRLKIERMGPVTIGSEKTQPLFDCDGDVWKGTNVTYESFPLSNGVIESFEFYAPMILMEMLANADDATLNLEGAKWLYPHEMRQDYMDLYNMVKDRNKQAQLRIIQKESKPSFK